MVKSDGRRALNRLGGLSLPDPFSCLRYGLFSEAGAVWYAPEANVAQLVEQRFRKPQVTGSSPVIGSITKDLQQSRIR